MTSPYKVAVSTPGTKTAAPHLVRPSASAALKNRPTATAQSTGPAGVGVPAGGRPNQLLAKASSADYATTWSVALTVGTTAPSSPSVGDVWIDTT